MTPPEPSDWPDFDLYAFFEGPLRAWGIFEDRFGVLRRSFVVDITGEVTDGQLKLNERFEYEDGVRDQRIWQITRLANGLYQGQAEDIPGLAVGEISGRMLRWQYPLRLVTDRYTIKVKVDDFIYRMTDDAAFSRGYISKFGIRLGSVTLFFKRLET